MQGIWSRSPGRCALPTCVIQDSLPDFENEHVGRGEAIAGMSEKYPDVALTTQVVCAGSLTRWWRIRVNR